MENFWIIHELIGLVLEVIMMVMGIYILLFQCPKCDSQIDRIEWLIMAGFLITIAKV